jgi:hypothetical protein
MVAVKNNLSHILTGRQGMALFVYGMTRRVWIKK